MAEPNNAERERLRELKEGDAPWHRWGPYLAERQWGTVREDYSPDGEAWTSFPHEDARPRTYRWGEDGLLGICDDKAQLCFALALWNGADAILKERLFGLTGPQGNHGEDVKECYFFLDSTPTHSYLKALYKYPQRAFPYEDLIAENARRSREQREYELIDTGIFAEDRYFDVMVEYAKAAPDDIVIRITATNRGPDEAPLHLLPTLWFRNTWSLGYNNARPSLQALPPADGMRVITADHAELGGYTLACQGAPDLLFTENESNTKRLWGGANRTPYVKDGINDAIVGGAADAVNPDATGTKAAAHYTLTVGAGATETVLLRLSSAQHAAPFADAEAVLGRRIAEADAFYASVAPAKASEDERNVQRQAFAGLMWSKQLYYYDVEQWLNGDPAGPPPPAARSEGRNSEWRHLNNADIISMPDTWEYPWYAAWDLAFHCIPIALIDPEFAKGQLILMLREWYMHPNGQLPAYEWNFGDVNPPVHAWAAKRVYDIDRLMNGKPDRDFLERVFHKLLLNFTWWVNRKDSEGHNVFQGGFLGLDNIGVFDRSKPLPTGGHVEQADGTAWMGMYCLNMLSIALELARENRVYEDVATKFFEHFMYIAGALNNVGGDGISLWDDNDEFFYDVLHTPDGETKPLRVRSLVGLIPLLAVETIEPEVLEALPEFKAHLEWFLEHRTDLAGLVSHWHVMGDQDRRLLALVRGHRMKRLLSRMLDPQEFLSDYGVRSLSRYHAEHPYELDVDGTPHVVSYEPAESKTSLFGGNSNWRGPVWFPVNYLLIEALQKFHRYYSDDFLVESPTGSGEKQTLAEIASDISRRLTRIFLRDDAGRRAVFGEQAMFQQDPLSRDCIPFYEYFHGETGAGLGASHQTGWTALVATLLAETQAGSD
ncbi:MAG: glucosidase [Chloroflexota bacterium]|nr:glucosidase [Chloroflexota bacterium]